MDRKPDEEVLIPGTVVNLMILQRKPRLQAWREYLGFTQEDVAKRLGITKNDYAGLESKYRRLHTSRVKKLAAALGIEWEQLS